MNPDPDNDTGASSIPLLAPLEARMIGAMIEKALATLTPREAEVISLYFGINREQPLTLEEIGERFGLTRERVRQIKEKAIRRLRHNSRSRPLKSYLH